MKNPAIRLDNGLPHQARKRFGQNFLHDRTVIDRAIAAIRPDEHDHVLEIGPGQGALTDSLARLAGRLDCVELDRDLAAFLERRFAGRDTVRVIQGDILRFDLAALNPAPHALRVIGNLPYNISTPLLFRLYPLVSEIRDMHFMLQREVVDRITAEPSTPDYGRLSVMSHFYCHAEKLFEVAPDAFTPSPKVTSAVVRLKAAKHELIADNVAVLEQLVTRAFSNRRKTIRNGFKGALDAGRLEALGIDPGLRPENLTLEAFVRCANEVSRREANPAEHDS